MRKELSKGSLVLSVLLGCLLLALVTPCWAGVQDITVVNRTGVDIYGLYISESHSDYWEENLMEGDVLRPGQSVEISFDGYNRRNCYWDILITDENDDELMWEGLNLCQIWKVTLHWNGSQGWADLD